MQTNTTQTVDWSPPVERANLTLPQALTIIRSNLARALDAGDASDVASFELVVAAGWLADYVDPPTFAVAGTRKVHAAQYDHDDAGELWRRVLCGGLVPVKVDAAPESGPEYPAESPEACASCVRHLPAHRRPPDAPRPAQRPTGTSIDGYRVRSTSTGAGVALDSPGAVPVFVSVGPVELVELNTRARDHAKQSNRRVA